MGASLFLLFLFFCLEEKHGRVQYKMGIEIGRRLVIDLGIRPGISLRAEPVELSDG